MLHAAEGVTRLEATSPLHAEEVQPEIKLRSLVQNYRAAETKVVPLGERDAAPDSHRVYELQATYNFSVPKATEITPNFSWLSNVLYESEFESQLWMLYNGHKQLVACGDAYPGKYGVKVEKDDYTVRVHVRGEKPELLEKLADMPLLVSSKISTATSMDVYSSHAQASTFGRKMSSVTLNKGDTLPFYVAPLANDKHGKNGTAGQYLTGTMTLAKDEIGKKTDSYSVKYILAEPFRSKSSSGSGHSGGGGGKSNKKTEAEKLRDSVAEHKTGWLAKMDPAGEEAKGLFESLKTEEGVNQV